jgi:hypothetical protein
MQTKDYCSAEAVEQNVVLHLHVVTECSSGSCEAKLTDFRKFAETSDLTKTYSTRATPRPGQ